MDTAVSTKTKGKSQYGHAAAVIAALMSREEFDLFYRIKPPAEKQALLDSGFVQIEEDE